MILKDIRGFIQTLPTDFDEYEMVNGEEGSITLEDGKEKVFYRADKPIITVMVDEETKEICFLHQYQKKKDNIKEEIKGKIDENI